MNNQLLVAYDSGWDFAYCVSHEETRRIAKYRMLLFSIHARPLIDILYQSLLSHEALFGKVSLRPWQTSEIRNCTLFFQSRKQAIMAKQNHYENPLVCLASPLLIDEKKDLGPTRRYLRRSGILMTAEELYRKMRGDHQQHYSRG